MCHYRSYEDIKSTYETSFCIIQWPEDDATRICAHLLPFLHTHLLLLIIIILVLTYVCLYINRWMLLLFQNTILWKDASDMRHSHYRGVILLIDRLYQDILYLLKYSYSCLLYSCAFGCVVWNVIIHENKLNIGLVWRKQDLKIYAYQVCMILQAKYAY